LIRQLDGPLSQAGHLKNRRIVQLTVQLLFQLLYPVCLIEDEV
jgi:hypothetical protein